MKRIAVLISAVLIVLIAISASGCTSSTTPSATPSTTAKDYTQHYNAAFNTTNFTGASFSTSKSADNNDLYTNVFANASNGTVTFAIEIMPSQTAAQAKFDKVVANQTNAGYINASSLLGPGNVTFFSPGTVSPMGTVQSEWTGVSVQTHQVVAIYLTQDSGADNNWTVTTMTVTTTSTSGAS